MFTDSEILSLRRSFERVWPHDEESNDRGRLIRAFYERFFQACPEAASLFKNVHMRKQRRMLFTAIASVVHNLENHDQMEKYLVELGHRHKSYGATSSQFTVFLECLLDRIRAADSAAWDAEIEALWHRALWMICARMQEQIDPID